MKNKSALLILTLLILSGCGSSKTSSESYSSSQSSDYSSVSSLEESSESVSSLSSSEELSSEELSSEESSEEESREEFSSEELSSEESSEDLSSEEISSEEESSSEEIPTYDPSLFYDGYYSSITSWEDGEDLKEQLYTLLHNDNYHPLNYNKPNWVSNSLADKSLKDFQYVDAVYSANDISVDMTHRGWQREHAFPATLMTGSQSSEAVRFLGRATDFHNLFASDASGNMSRGNKNYGVADKTSESYQDRTTGGGYDGYSFDEMTFEPAAYDKGRLARAIFYMATMYSKDEFDSANNVYMKGLQIVEDNVPYVAGDNCHFAIGHLSELLSWNEYPVDYLEMQHNQSVYSDIIEIHTNPYDNYAQGNRNPFVDYPELVEYVYGDKKDEAGELKYMKPTYLNLNMDKDEFNHYAIEYAKREYGYEETLTKDDYSIVAVNNNMTYQRVSEGVSNSLDGYTFSNSDPDNLKATIYVSNETLSYDISLNPMNNCSFNTGALNKTGLAINTTKEVTYNNEKFDVSITGGTGLTISNDSQGGFYLGSGTSGKDLQSITFTSKSTYYFDRLFIKCRANNQSSAFSLTVKVGEETVINGISIRDNGGIHRIYGGHFAPTYGQISIILKGSNALRIHSFAFNVYE